MNARFGLWTAALAIVLPALLASPWFVAPALPRTVRSHES